VAIPVAIIQIACAHLMQSVGFDIRALCLMVIPRPQTTVQKRHIQTNKNIELFSPRLRAKTERHHTQQ